MRKLAWATAALLIIMASSAMAGDGIMWKAGPLYGMNDGDTRYELSFDGGGSELIFPLDFNTAGGGIELVLLSMGRPDWTFGLEYRTAISDASSKFSDDDWLTIDVGTILGVAYTESDVASSMLDLRFTVSKNVTRSKSFELALLASLQYNKIKTEALGYEGWQLAFDSLGYAFNQNISYDGLALTYEIKTLQPGIGLAPTVIFGSGLELRAQAQALVLVQIDDVDDHILRTFKAEGSGTGSGYRGGLCLDYTMPASVKRHWQPFAAVSFDFTHITADIDGARTYYEDNEFDGYEAGEGFDQKTEITFNGRSIGFRAGIAF